LNELENEFERISREKEEAKRVDIMSVQTGKSEVMLLHLGSTTKAAPSPLDGAISFLVEIELYRILPYKL